MKDCFALLIEKDLQKPASPLQGFLSLRSNPGLRPLRGLRPGLCSAALSALGIDLPSLTHMPYTSLNPRKSAVKLNRKFIVIAANLR